MKFKKVISLAAGAAMALAMSASAFAAGDAVSPELAPGTYEVPITSVDTSAPLQPVKDAVNGAFGESVKVIVAEDGSAKVQIENQHMSINMASWIPTLGVYEANMAVIDNTTTLSTMDTNYTNINGNLMDSSVHELVAITVPKLFEADLALDDNNAQVFSVSVDFMAAMNGQAIEDYRTNITLNLDMDSAVKLPETFGLAGTALEPGAYTLPLSMKNASNINNNSMAAGCIAGARLKVNESGKSSITVDLQPVTAFGITLSASDWSIYQTEKVTAGQNTKAQFTADSTGAVNSITFDVPDNSWDGIYVNMFIGAPMNVYQDAYFAIDYQNAVPYVPAPTAAVTDLGTSDIEGATDSPVKTYMTTFNGDGLTKKTAVWTFTVTGKESKPVAFDIPQVTLNQGGEIKLGIIIEGTAEELALITGAAVELQ